MRARHVLTSIGTAAMVLLASTLATGCGRGGPHPAGPNAERVEREVKDLVERWARAFEARDLPSVRAVLSKDDRFVWLEDGEPRYRSVEEIVRALGGFPAELSFTHALRELRIVPVSEDAAWVHLAASTTIRHSGRAVSEFTSVVLMIVRRDEAGWRIHAGHTSTSNPRGQAPG